MKTRARRGRSRPRSARWCARSRRARRCTASSPWRGLAARFDGPALVHDAHARHRLDARADPRRGRALRRAVVRGRRAHAGDRRAHGAGRAGARRCAAWWSRRERAWSRSASSSASSAAVAATRALGSLLFGVEALDVATFVGVAVTMVGSACSRATCRRGGRRASIRSSRSGASDHGQSCPGDAADPGT